MVNSHYQSWSRFTLRFLLLAVATLSLLFGAYLYPARQQHRFVDRLKAADVVDSFEEYETEQPHLSDHWRLKPRNWSVAGLIAKLLGDEFAPVRRLWVAGPKLRDDHVQQIIKTLPDLEILLVQGENVTDEGLDSLAKLQRLTALSLDATKISDNSMKQVGMLKRLQAFTASETKVTDEGLKELAGSRTLTLLNLSNTLVTDNGVTSFANTVPQLDDLRTFGNYFDRKFPIE